MNTSVVLPPGAALTALIRQKAVTFIAGLLGIFLTGCMATQNRWQATQMRQQVMDYYDDQIMENLIRASKNLPFVHVDVTSLTATDVASLTGSIGDGETTSYTRTGSGLMNGMLTVARGLTRPFSYSITPARNTSLQVIASPVLGQLSTEPEQASASPSATPTLEQSKVTKVTGAKEELQQTMTELTPKPNPTPTPKIVTVYTLYDNFVKKYRDTAFCHTDGLQSPTDYVPGTKKRWGNQFYYIKDTPPFRAEYYKFCKSLFTKGHAQSVEKAVEATANAAAQAAEARTLTR